VLAFLSNSHKSFRTSLLNRWAALTALNKQSNDLNCIPQATQAGIWILKALLSRLIQIYSDTSQVLVHIKLKRFATPSKQTWLSGKFFWTKDSRWMPSLSSLSRPSPRTPLKKLTLVRFSWSNLVKPNIRRVLQKMEADATQRKLSAHQRFKRHKPTRIVFLSIRTFKKLPTSRTTSTRRLLAPPRLKINFLSQGGMYKAVMGAPGRPGRNKRKLRLWCLVKTSSCTMLHFSKNMKQKEPIVPSQSLTLLISNKRPKSWGRTPTWKLCWRMASKRIQIKKRGLLGAF